MKRFFILLTGILLTGTLIGCSESHEAKEITGKSANLFNEDVALRFAVIPDTQGAKYSDGITHEPTIILDAITKELANREVDFVLNVGDITDKRTNVEYSEWVSSMSALLDEGISVYPVRGNHEVVDGKDWNGWRKDGEAHVGEHYDAGAALWRHYTDPLLETVTKMPGDNNLSYYFINENSLFIGLDLYDSDINENMYRGAWLHLYNWIEDVIESNKDEVDHIFVFAHEPFTTRKRPHAVESEEYYSLMDPIEGKMSYSDISQLGLLSLQDRSETGLMNNLLSLFAKNRVHYISGHDHQYIRSLIHTEENNSKSDYFYQTIAGNASFKSYTNNYGVYDPLETGLAQDNYGGDINAASFLIYEIAGKQVTMEYWVAEHTLTVENQEDNLTWENPKWVLGDKVTYTSDAKQYVVAPRENYWGVSEQPADENYIGTSVAILEGYNQIFNIYETKGENLTLPKEDKMSELISFSWFYDQDETTLSDIVLIDGMHQQSGIRVNAKGEVMDDQTHIPASIANVDATKAYSRADNADTYVLSLSVPKDIDITTTTIGYFDESTQSWVDALETKKFVPTAYSDDFMTGEVPDGTDVDKAIDAYNLWGYNHQTHTIWAMMQTDGYFSIIQK